MSSKIRCLRPFYNLELHTKGKVSFCCPHWTKIEEIGNIKTMPLQDIWNSETAQFIRSKIYSDELKEVCDVELCPHLNKERGIKFDNIFNLKLPLTKLHCDEIVNKRTSLTLGPTRINVANWDDCNLKCVMCGAWRNIYRVSSNIPEDLRKRQSKIRYGVQAELANKTYKDLQEILPSLKIMRLTGAGEPLFRSDTRKILFMKDKPSDLKIELATNGLLLTPYMWQRIKHSNFSCINVSIDAASETTYEKIRKKGDWRVLLQNLKFISDLRKEEKIRRFFINFVVMRSNYKEIISFIKMGKNLGCDGIFFQRVRKKVDNKENFFSPPEKNLLLELDKIKKEATDLKSKNCKINFGNI